MKETGTMSDLGAISPPTRTILNEVLSFHEERGGGSVQVIGKTSAPENRTGRALDFEVSGTDGDALADYLAANRGRLGLVRLVWNGHEVDKRGKISARPGPAGTTLHAFFDGRRITGEPITSVETFDWGPHEEESEPDEPDESEQDPT